MDKVLETLNLFKNLKLENIIDLLIAIVIALIFWIISNGIAHLIARIERGKKIPKEKIKYQPLYVPIKWYVRISGIYLATLTLKIPSDLTETILKIYKTGCIWIVARAVSDILNPRALIFKKLEEKTSYRGDKALNNFVSKVIKVLSYIIAGYISVLEWGYNLGGLATGLGISSVVIAFAAQDIAKNLFAGAAILTDKPFIVGDWIETKEYSGTVIDITFRSTKIKGIDNTTMTVENSKILADVVKNWTGINKRRFKTTLNLPLETPRVTIERLMNKITFVLTTDINILHDTLKVHLEDIDKSAIQIVIYFNTPITDYEEFESFKDKINLEIVDILSSENVKLAYPSNTVYIKEKEKRAEKELKKENTKR